MDRAAFYIDGLNLYHAIRALTAKTGTNCTHLRWLSLRALAERIIPHKTEQLLAVNYFAARVEHLSDKALQKQDLYVRALRATNVNCEIAHFTKKDRTCKKCSRTTCDHEEKETDVALALKMAMDAGNDVADIFYLITTDTDLVPVYRLFHHSFPNKRIVPVCPPHRNHPNAMLKLLKPPVRAPKAPPRKLALTIDTLAHCLLPHRITDGHGAITRPADYDPPPG